MTIHIKQNDEKKETELWLDGEFLASWNQFDIPENIYGQIIYMLNDAFEYGKQAKAKEIRKVLRVDND